MRDPERIIEEIEGDDRSRFLSLLGGCVLFGMAMLALVFLALTIGAQNVERCVEQRRGHPAPPPCIPPATYRTPNAKPPFDMPLKYGYVGKIGGQDSFIWLKGGEPSRPCTAAEAKNGSAYKMLCAARIGDPVVILPQFRELPRAEIAAESAAVGTALPAIRRVDDLDMLATVGGDRFCRTGTALAACTGKRRYFIVAIQVADMLRGSDKASTSDDLVLDFGRMACGLNSDGSVAAVCRWMSYRPLESFAVNSWVLAPVENDSRGDQHVQFAVNGGLLLTPIMRIRDLPVISVGELK